MSQLMTWWRQEIDRNPVVVLWLLLWWFNAFLNARLGWEIAGGQGPVAVVFGGVFFALAGFGAWAATQYQHAHGRRALLVGMVVVIQLFVGQMAGWQSFGLTLARGAGMLESKAEGRATVHTALTRARAERDQIGIVRPVAAIQADAVLECEKRSRRYPDGIGPKCTALRAELATAERARKLEADIASLTSDLGKGAQIKDPNALYQVPQAMAQSVSNLWAWLGGGEAQKVTPDDVRFGWLVFIVFALEFLATLGPGLLHLGVASAPISPAPGAGGGPGRQQRGPQAPHDPREIDLTGSEWHGRDADDMRTAVARLLDASRALPAPDPFVQLAAPGAGQSAPWATEGARQYGSPINIHLGGGAVPTPLVPQTGDGGSFQIWPPNPEAAQPAKRPRQDLPALPADSPPVDRSKILRDLSPEEREAADVILAFRAACVVDAPGGVVDSSRLYARYSYWAGPRALDEPAFHALLQDLTGIEAVEIGGLGHYRGVALRAAPAMKEIKGAAA